MKSEATKADRIEALRKLALSPANRLKRAKRNHAAQLREEQNERHEVRVLARYGLL